MATSFVFWPHVHEREIIATPDILIDDLKVICGNKSVSIPIDRLTMDNGFQVPGSGTLPDAAIALVGSSAGMLIGVASDHRDRHDNIGRLSCAKPICREVWRFADVSGHTDALVLSTLARRTDGSQAIVQQARVGQILKDVMLARGQVVLLTGLKIEGMVVSSAFEISLKDQVLQRQITLRYGITELTG